jgi:hypothetical protein
VVEVLDTRRYDSMEQYCCVMEEDGVWVDEVFVLGFALLFKLTIISWSTALGDWVTIRGGDREEIYIGCRDHQHFYGSKPLPSSVGTRGSSYVIASSKSISLSTSVKAISAEKGIYIYARFFLKANIIIICIVIIEASEEQETLNNDNSEPCDGSLFLLALFLHVCLYNLLYYISLIYTSFYNHIL